MMVIFEASGMLELRYQGLVGQRLEIGKSRHAVDMYVDLQEECSEELGKRTPGEPFDKRIEDELVAAICVPRKCQLVSHTRIRKWENG